MTDMFQLTVEPELVSRTDRGSEFRYTFDEPIVLSGSWKRLGLAMKLPEVDDRPRRAVRVRFSPETRPAPGGKWSVHHGEMESRHNADGLWFLTLLLDVDEATGDLTVHGLKANHSASR